MSRLCGLMIMVLALSLQAGGAYALSTGTIAQSTVTTTAEAVSALQGGQFKSALQSIISSGNSAALAQVRGLLNNGELQQINATAKAQQIDAMIRILMGKKDQAGFVPAISGVMSASSMARTGGVADLRQKIVSASTTASRSSGLAAATTVRSLNSNDIEAAREVTKSGVKDWLNRGWITSADANLFSLAGPTLIGRGLSLVDSESGRTCWTNLGQEEVATLVAVINSGMGRTGVDMITNMANTMSSMIHTSFPASLNRLDALAEEKANGGACEYLAPGVASAARAMGATGREEAMELATAE